MPNRMNRDEFYAAMARHDDACLRKILWTVYWRGNAQLRERIEDELRPQDQPKVKPKKEPPDPASVLDEVTTFVELAKDGAYMAGDRRVHHTERSRWRHTFRRLVADTLAALAVSDPAPAQQAVAKIVDLACDMKRYDYFHSDDPVCSRDRWDGGGHQATLRVSVSSSGGPTSASRTSSASRKSAIAASCVGPSPTAPTPGRSWAAAHQTPSSSCSMAYGT